MVNLTGPVAPLLPEESTHLFTTLLPSITFYPGVTTGADPIHLELALFKALQFHPEQRRSNMRWDVDLHRVARLRVEDMRVHRYINHVDADGHGPNWWLNHFGELPDWYPQGDGDNSVESIRLGPGDATDALAALLASPSHRDHVLGLGWFGGQTRMGIGVGPDWDLPPSQWIFCILSCH